MLVRYDPKIASNHTFPRGGKTNPEVCPKKGPYGKTNPEVCPKKRPVGKTTSEVNLNTASQLSLVKSGEVYIRYSMNGPF